MNDPLATNISQTRSGFFYFLVINCYSGTESIRASVCNTSSSSAAATAAAATAAATAATTARFFISS
jgi:hypothetical protein